MVFGVLYRCSAEWYLVYCTGVVLNGTVQVKDEEREQQEKIEEARQKIEHLFKQKDTPSVKILIETLLNVSLIVNIGPLHSYETF